MKHTGDTYQVFKIVNHACLFVIGIVITEGPVAMNKSSTTDQWSMPLNWGAEGFPVFCFATHRKRKTPDDIEINSVKIFLGYPSFRCRRTALIRIQYAPKALFKESLKLSQQKVILYVKPSYTVRFWSIIFDYEFNISSGQGPPNDVTFPGIK